MSKFPFVVRRVQGHSMAPTLSEGKILFARKNRSPRRDDIVIAKYSEGFEVVKRVVDMRYGLIYLDGDNEGHTKRFAVSPDDIIAVL